MKIELIIYAKNNYDKLKNIYDKIRNKNKKKINNNKNKNIFESCNKIKKSNNNLIKENKIKTKKVKNENSYKNTKNHLKTKCLILNNKSSKEKKSKKNKEKKNQKTNKSTPIKNKRIKSLEDKLNISGLNDVKKFEKVQNILSLNDYEKNNLEYNLAKKLDKRSYTQYYIPLLRTKHLLIFSFIQSKDYNSKVIKIILFFFILTINFTINALFFNDSTMHVIYLEKGKLNFIYQIPQIIYSSLISGVLTAIFRYLSLTEKTVLSLKNEKNLHIFEQKKENTLKTISKKIIAFFIISFCLLLFCWYYIACFCAVYKNTQIHLIKDFICSFSFSLIYPFFIYLLPGIFRISSLRNKKSETMYKFSLILQAV